jgi:hypothetical protein
MADAGTCFLLNTVFLSFLYLHMCMRNTSVVACVPKRSIDRRLNQTSNAYEFPGRSDPDLVLWLFTRSFLSRTIDLWGIVRMSFFCCQTLTGIMGVGRYALTSFLVLVVDDLMMHFLVEEDGMGRM